MAIATGERAGRDTWLAAEAGGGAGAYHAVPPKGHGRGVLVLGEGGPLGDFAREACDRLARAGFAALAPDLSDAVQASGLLEAGVRFLLDDAATDGGGVGALGFGQGGALALAAGARHARVRCVVDFYGVPEPGTEAFDAAPEVPTLLVFGAEDGRVAEGAAGALEARLAKARLVLEPGAAAGFMNETRPDRHVAAAAAAGWDAAIAFLGASL